MEEIVKFPGHSWGRSGSFHRLRLPLDWAQQCNSALRAVVQHALHIACCPFSTQVCLCFLCRLCSLYSCTDSYNKYIVHRTFQHLYISHRTPKFWSNSQCFPVPEFGAPTVFSRAAFYFDTEACYTVLWHSALTQWRHAPLCFSYSRQHFHMEICQTSTCSRNTICSLHLFLRKYFWKSTILSRILTKNRLPPWKKKHCLTRCVWRNVRERTGDSGGLTIALKDVEVWMTLAANVTFFVNRCRCTYVGEGKKYFPFYFVGEDWRKIESIPESKCGN